MTWWGFGLKKWAEGGKQKQARERHQKNSNGEGGRTLVLTFSKEAGLTIEKQMRKTSVWG